MVDADLDGMVVRHSGDDATRIEKPKTLCAARIFNHLTHPRSQLLAMLTAAGAEPEPASLSELLCSLEKGLRCGQMRLVALLRKEGGSRWVYGTLRPFIGRLSTVAARPKRPFSGELPAWELCDNRLKFSVCSVRILAGRID